MSNSSGFACFLASKMFARIRSSSTSSAFVRGSRSGEFQPRSVNECQRDRRRCMSLESHDWSGAVPRRWGTYFLNLSTSFSNLVLFCSSSNSSSSSHPYGISSCFLFRSLSFSSSHMASWHPRIHWQHRYSCIARYRLFS